eukprot:5695435-Prymnesium_polylepis.1
MGPRGRQLSIGGGAHVRWRARVLVARRWLTVSFVMMLCIPINCSFSKVRSDSAWYSDCSWTRFVSKVV